MTELPPKCCGQPMSSDKDQPVLSRLGLRVWHCVHRPAHRAVFENVETGERQVEGVQNDDR